jgi:hypothetical protein
MRWLSMIVVLSACEKSDSSTSTARPTRVIAADAGLSHEVPIVRAMPDAAAVVQVPIDARLEPDKLEAYANALAFEGPATSVGDMNKRRPGADLARQINDVRDGARAVDLRSGSWGGSRRDVGTAAVGSGPPVVSTPGRISVASKQALDDSTLTPDLVVSKIMAAYMAGIKRCYKQELARDPNARGKLALSLTVDDAGRTTSAKASGFSSELDGCVSGQMSGWRFPIPKDKDGNTTDASFQIAITLVPS